MNTHIGMTPVAEEFQTSIIFPTILFQYSNNNALLNTIIHSTIYSQQLHYHILYIHLENHIILDQKIALDFIAVWFQIVMESYSNCTLEFTVILVVYVSIGVARMHAQVEYYN